MRSTTFALTALASLSAASAENVFFTAKSSDNSVNGPISSIHEGAGINYFLVATGATGSGEVFDLENGVASNKQGNFPANVGALGSYLAAGPAVSPSTLKFNGDAVDNYNFWACKNTNDPYSYSANSPIIAINSKDNSTAPFSQCTPVTISKSAVSSGSSSASASASAAASTSSAVSSAHNGWTNGTTVTTDITVTGYTTYCPASTVVTITTCSEKKCAPTTVTVTEATTLTVTGECVVPTTYTTTPSISTHYSSAAAASSASSSASSTHSTAASVTISQGGADKAVVGAAGLIAGALAMLV